MVLISNCSTGIKADDNAVIVMDGCVISGCDTAVDANKSKVKITNTRIVKNDNRTCDAQIDKNIALALIKELSALSDDQFCFHPNDYKVRYMDYFISNNIISATKHSDIDGGGVYMNLVIYPNPEKQLEKLFVVPNKSSKTFNFNFFNFSLDFGLSDIFQWFKRLFK